MTRIYTIKKNKEVTINIPRARLGQFSMKRLVDERGSPLDAMLTAERCAPIEDAFLTLKLHEEYVLWLKDQGQTRQEIANSLESRVATVRNIERRARGKLRRQLSIGSSAIPV
jgi:DNA-directed RNA polymerase specialized sigma24 family protein